MSQFKAPNGKPSNLTPEQWKLVRTPQFKAWFGDWENDPENASKVVDENGEPLVVYHATNSIFNEFSYDKTSTGGAYDSIGFYFTEYKQYKSSSFYGKIIKKCFLNLRNPMKVAQGFYRDKATKHLLKPQLVKLLRDGNSKDRDEKEFVEFLMRTFVHTNENYEKIESHRPIENQLKFIWQEYYFNRYADDKGENMELFQKSVIKNTKFDGAYIVNANYYVAFLNTQIKLADGTNTTFDGNNPDIRFAEGGEVKSNSFMKWYIDWYKGICDKMFIAISLPNAIQPFKEKNVVILDVFEKKDQSINSKPYLKKIVEKANEYGVVIYLKPKDNIEQYQKFGFELTPNKQFMKRIPNFSESADIRFAEGGTTNYGVDELYDIATRTFIGLGYDVTEGSNSKTDYGHSRYFYVNQDNKADVNSGLGFQVRVSDHSTGDRRILNGEQFIFDNKDVMEVFNRINYWFHPEEYKNVVVVKTKVVQIEVGENDLQPSDSIISERVAKSGSKRYTIKRTYKNEGVVPTHKFSGHKLPFKPNNPDFRFAEGGKTKRYMKKIKRGGITYGKSHAEGGIPVKNQSTGDMLEVEGGEGIVNKRSMASKSRVKLNGKEMTICEAVSQLNQMEGGVKFSCEDVSDRQFIKAMAKGGELERGTRTEQEHIQVLKDLYAKRITPKQASERIAKDHLKEDSRYYSKLAKMEGKMAKGGKVKNDYNVPSTEDLVNMVTSAREKQIKKVKQSGVPIVIGRNDGYYFKTSDSPNYSEEILSSRPSKRKVIEIIESNPNITEVYFQGSIRGGDYIGDVDFDIVDDFAVLLWKKPIDVNNAIGTTLQWTETEQDPKNEDKEIRVDPRVYMIVKQEDAHIYKDRPTDDKYFYMNSYLEKNGEQSSIRIPKLDFQNLIEEGELETIEVSQALKEQLLKPMKTYSKGGKMADGGKTRKNAKTTLKEAVGFDINSIDISKL